MWQGLSTKRPAAKRLLRELLLPGPQEAHHAIAAICDALSVSEHTVRRAKKELGVVSEQDCLGWTWRLP